MGAGRARPRTDLSRDVRQRVQRRPAVRRPDDMSRAFRSVLPFVLAVAGAGVLLVTGSLPASACSCAVGPPATQAEADARLAEADVAFVGSLESRADTPPDADGVISSGDPAVLTFAVSTVFKGDATARQEVVTARSGSTCGLDVPGRTPFLVFAERDADGVLRTSSCGGGTPEVGLATWRGAPPDGAVVTPDRPTPVALPQAGGGTRPTDARRLLDARAVAGVLTVVVVGGLAVVLRRRRPAE